MTLQLVKSSHWVIGGNFDLFFRKNLGFPLCSTTSQSPHGHNGIGCKSNTSFWMTAPLLLLPNGTLSYRLIDVSGQNRTPLAFLTHRFERAFLVSAHVEQKLSCFEHQTTCGLDFIPECLWLDAVLLSLLPRQWNFSLWLISGSYSVSYPYKTGRWSVIQSPLSSSSSWSFCFWKNAAKILASYFRVVSLQQRYLK